MNKIILLNQELQLPINESFKLFIESNHLINWLTTKAEIDPIEGGLFQLFWDPSDRENNSTIGCKITAIRKNEIVCFEWKSPIQFKEFANKADPLTHVSVSFHRISSNKTVINLIHTGWRNTKEWEEARIWQMNAWKMAFEELKEYVNTMSSAN